jgi:F-type H+-transporting ATPase subunit a
MTDVGVFADPVIVFVAGIPVTRATLTAFTVSLALVAAAAAMRRATLSRPGSALAVIAEMAVEFPERLVAEVIGRPVPWLSVFAGSLFYFLAGCAVAGQLPGVRTPTSNLSVTSALAVAVFITVPAAGIRARGVRGYFRHYVTPSPLMLPLELMSELSRTFALSVRLFGNMLSGYLIVALLVALVGVFVPTPLMALDLLIGLLQAYIFAVLSIVYIGAALRTQEGA